MSTCRGCYPHDLFCVQEVDSRKTDARLAGKQWIARNHLEKALETYKECKTSPTPQLLLDMGLVEFQLGRMSKAISVTKDCVSEIDWQLSQSNPTFAEDFELRRLLATAHYNLMSYRLKLSLSYEAKNDGEAALLVIKQAEQHLRAKRKEENSSSKESRGQATPVSFNSRAWTSPRTQGALDTHGLILLEYGEMEGFPALSNVAHPAGAVDEATRQRLGVLANLEQKIINKLQQVHSKIQHKLEDDDAMQTLDMKIFERRQAVEGELTGEAIGQTNGSIESKRVQTSVSKEIQNSKQSIRPSIKPALCRKQPAQPRLISPLLSQGRINQTETGVRMKNCDLSSFLTEPLYVLDEFAMENEKKSLARHSIGRIIRNSHVAIYSGICERSLHTSLQRIDGRRNSSSSTVNEGIFHKRSNIQKHQLLEAKVSVKQAPYLLGGGSQPVPIKREVSPMAPKGVFIIKSKASKS